MRLYLDSNVFDLVLQAAEEAQFSAWLRARKALVILSDEHLIEALPISDAVKRRALLSLLTNLPSRHAEPSAFLDAQEVLGEVRRLRPGWLRPFPDTTRISVWLNRSMRKWSDAKLHPDRLAQKFSEVYRPVAQAGIRLAREEQRSQRDALLEGADRGGGFTVGNYFVATPGGRHDDDELWWRKSCLVIWHNALFNRPEVMRDYVDYLGPYLRRGIEISDFVSFWLSDVEREPLRRNAVVSLVEREQLKLENRARKRHGLSTPAMSSTPTTS